MSVTPHDWLTAKQAASTVFGLMVSCLGQPDVAELRRVLDRLGPGATLDEDEVASLAAAIRLALRCWDVVAPTCPGLDRAAVERVDAWLWGQQPRQIAMFTEAAT